ncbi:MAG: crossover junction endodeoxyribonuclease RuvC [Dehalococcoidia bacterium]|nr:crossover junction endodeoxyribonuclease RuvC [Dehalococcoidia bacterium]
MIVLGVDPGTIQMGYGVIKSDDQRLSYIDCGVLKAPAKVPMEERLYMMFLKLKDVIEKYHPGEAAIERPFVSKNAQSAIAIGQAQAVAILAAQEKGLTVFQYTPSKVKQSATNYGGSTKDQVQRMVWLQLDATAGTKVGGSAGLGYPFTETFDPTDALAVAICHTYELRLANSLAQLK